MPMRHSLRKNLTPAKSKKLETASLRCDLNCEDDPWRVSAFFSAFMELVLSILLLLGTTIAFLTSQLVKYFDLNPPCTYIGCTHGFESKSIAGQKRFCCNRHRGDEFYSEYHSPLPYSKLQSNEHLCTDEYDNKECCHLSNRWIFACSSDSPNCRHHNQLKQKGVDEAYLPLVSTRSSSELSSFSDAEDHCGRNIMTNDRMNIGSEDPLITAFEIAQKHPQGYENIKLQRFEDVMGICRNREDTEVVLKGIDVMPMEGLSEVDKEKQVDGGSLPKSNSECMASSGLKGVELMFDLGTSMEAEVVDRDIKQHFVGLHATQSHKQGLEMGIDLVGDDDDHSFAPEESLVQGLIKTEVKVNNVKSASNCLNDLQSTSLEQTQRHRTKIESVLVTTCSGSDEICDGHGKVHDEVSAPVDLHTVGNASVCTLPGDSAHVTDGPCDGDARSKPSLEMIIQEALDHYLTSFQGSTKDSMYVVAEIQQGEDIQNGAAEQRVACIADKDGDENQVCVEALKEALQAGKASLGALEAELEKERNAAAVATSEAMAMISRLQEEKSALQMEVAQLQRMSEERADYDEQAMVLLKEILLKREKEKHALEKEVELYRKKLLRTEKRSNDGRGSNRLSSCPLEPSMMLQRMEEGKVKPWSFSDGFHRAGITKAQAYRQAGVGNNEGRVRDAEERETTGSMFSSREEETEFILERLWVLEEELQCKAASVQETCNGNPVGNNDQSCVADSLGAKRVGYDDGAGTLSPVYDIYEVQSVGPNHDCCQELDECRVCPHECKSDIVSCCQHEVDSWDSHSQCHMVTGRRQMQPGIIQKLAMRLEVLESDRGLLREIWESLKQRDAELSLLQEMAHHLQTLSMVDVRRSFTSQVPFSRTFGKTCATAIKKRKYCKGPGQPHILLIHQRSI